jgi:hypothetical protein
MTTESARDEALRLAREAGIGSPVPGSENAWVLIPDELVRLVALARQRPGWVLVPEMPTEEMLSAGLAGWDYTSMTAAPLSNRTILAAVTYHRMLAAAPKPEEGK